MASQRKLGVGTKGILGGLVLVLSFAFGLWLGSRPHPVGREPSPSSPDVAHLFRETDTPRTPAASPEFLEQKHSPGSKRLRLRATTQISSREAKSGDSVLFVTDQPVHTESGERIPAGALVEAVVANAKRSSAETPGKLVIEIRTLHVGAQTIPLHALPYIPRTLELPELAGGSAAPVLTDPRGLRIRTQLRVNPEAVMPKESVIEFELVESQGLYLPGSAAPQGDVVPAPAQTLPDPVLQDAPSSPKVDPRPGLPTEKPTGKSRRFATASA